MKHGLLLWQSVLAALQFVSGSTVLFDVLDRRWVALFVMAVGAAQAGTAFYTRGLARPAETATGGAGP